MLLTSLPSAFKNRLSGLLLSVFVLTSSFSNALSPQEDVDFRLLETPLQNVPDIVVVSWYGSPSCFQVYGALVQAYPESQVTLWPAVFRESWRPAAKLAMMANQLNLTQERQLALFQKIILSPPDWKHPLVYQTLLMRPDSDPNVVEQTVRNTELPRQLKELQNTLDRVAISSVPTILFKGRFVIDAQQAKNPQHLLELIKALNDIQN